jgi:hypothetical protein
MKEKFENIYDIIKESEERKLIKTINEGMVYSERNFNRNTSPLSYAISIHGDGSQNERDGYTLDPYIKICNGPSWTSCTKTIRISMKDARCFHHNDGKGNLDMSLQLATYLNYVMDLDSLIKNTKTGKMLSVYDAIWYDINNRFAGYTYYEIIKFPKPDFTKFYTGSARKGPNDILIEQMKKRVDSQRKDK